MDLSSVPASLVIRWVGSVFDPLRCSYACLIYAVAAMQWTNDFAHVEAVKSQASDTSAGAVVAG